MKKLFKNWDDDRPKILYRFWMVLAFTNLSISLLLAWAGREYPNIDVVGQVWYSAILAGVCMGMSFLWRYYLENPEKYEELQKRRLGRTRRDSENKDKKE